MSSPRVSICIPVYNGEAYLAETIESAIRQNFQDFELIISDNASTDSTGEIVRANHDPRIRYERTGENIGPAGNFNRCIELARGKYIKILCADDLLYPSCLSSQAAILDHDTRHEIVMVSCARDIVDEHSHVRLRPRLKGLSRRIPAAEAVRSCIRSGTNIYGEPPCVLFRADQARAAGGFNPSYGICIDIDFWFRLLKLGDLYRQEEAFCAFRVSPNSWSSGLSGKQAYEYQRFLGELKDSHWLDLSDQDIKRSVRRAKRNDRLRRLFYLWLSASDFLRSPSKAIKT